MDQIRHQLDRTDLKYLQNFLEKKHSIRDPRLSEDIAKEIICSCQNGYDINIVTDISGIDLSKVSSQLNRIRIIADQKGAYLIVSPYDNLSTLSEKRKLSEAHVSRISELEAYLNSPDAREIARKFAKKSESEMSPEQIRQALMHHDAKLIVDLKQLDSPENLNRWADLPSIHRYQQTPSLCSFYYGRDLEKLLRLILNFHNHYRLRSNNNLSLNTAFSGLMT